MNSSSTWCHSSSLPVSGLSGLQAISRCSIGAITYTAPPESHSSKNSSRIFTIVSRSCASQSFISNLALSITLMFVLLFDSNVGDFQVTPSVQAVRVLHKSLSLLIPARRIRNFTFCRNAKRLSLPTAPRILYPNGRLSILLEHLKSSLSVTSFNLDHTNEIVMDVNRHPGMPFRPLIIFLRLIPALDDFVSDGA